jgi:hypothetical protein
MVKVIGGGSKMAKMTKEISRAVFIPATKQTSAIVLVETVKKLKALFAGKGTGI